MTNQLSYVAAGAEGLFDKNTGRWLFDISKMPIDHYLINASTFIGKKGVEVASSQYKEASTAGKTILCDSGGFQLATEVIDAIDPKGVVEVQNRVCDIGFILDVPTMKRARGAGAGGLELDASPEYFKECLGRTVQNLRSAKEIKRAFLYYAIIQGVNYHQLKEWWETIEKEDTFDGVGTKGVILSQVLHGLFFTETIGMTRHHILGLGAAPRILLVKYFYLCSKKQMESITYDNTNHIQYSKSMQTVMPFMNCSYSKSDDIAHFEKLSGIEMPRGMNEIFYASLKNLYFYGMQNKFINMMDTKEAVRDFVKSNFKAVAEYLNVIDDYFDKGIEYVLKRYPYLSFATDAKKQMADLTILFKGASK